MIKDKNEDPVISDYIDETDFWIKRLKDDVREARIYSESDNRNYMLFWEIMGRIAEDQKYVYKYLNEMMHYVIVESERMHGKAE